MAEPLAALGAVSAVLAIIDFSSKILSKSNELRGAFSGVLSENAELEKVSSHLHGLVVNLRQQQRPTTSNIAGQGQRPGLNEMIDASILVASELQVVLETLRVQGPITRWKSFRAAVKSVWKLEKIEDMQKRLNTIRDEIEFGIILEMRDDLVLLSEKQMIRFDALDSSTNAVLQAILRGQSAATAASEAQLRALKDVNKKLESLVVSENQRTRDEILEELRKQGAWGTRNVLTPHNLPQIDASQETEIPTDIMVTLKPITIGDRHNAIKLAHSKTFEWVWTNQGYSQDLWDNFWDWLTAGQGIYWISGKPGSGKSTLMKYLHQDYRTVQGLEQWAGQKKVISASFFFWNSGSTMQKSLTGFLQTIIYEVLDQRPDLVEHVFPKDVQKAISTRWKSRSPNTETIWTVKDLKDAFYRLLRVPSLQICLFIDGLDEHDGDYLEATELLNDVLSAPNIKACISSRPLPVFQNYFSISPRLRLQDLTYRDISLYVREKLEDQQEVLRMSRADPAEFRELIEEIIEKASGVFLWVTLAVKSLLEGISNYDRISDLRLRLREIPDELTNLYWHMLRSIKPAFYLGQAAKLLRIMEVATTESVTMAADDLFFADEYELDGDLVRTPRDTFHLYASSQRNVMAGRLASRCRGLLEVRDKAVVFLHQSVPEFLSQPDVKSSLDKHIQQKFNPYACIVAAILTKIKYTWLFKDLVSDYGQPCVRKMFWLSKKAEDERGAPNIDLMDDINLVFMEIRNRTIVPDRGYWSWKDYNISWAGIVAHANFPRPTAWNDTFISLCLQRGLIRYVSRKLDLGEHMRQGPTGRPLLDFLLDVKCLLWWTNYYTRSTIDEPLRLVDRDGYLELFRMLFERGADPNESFGGITMWDKILRIADGDYPWGDATLFCNFQDEDYYKKGKRRWPRLPYHSIWIDVMNIFLDYGADPGLNIGSALPGSVKPVYDLTQYDPLAFVDKFMAADRSKAIELRKRLKSLMSTQNNSHRNRTQLETKLPNAIIWDMLPKPDPSMIPGPPGTFYRCSLKVKPYPDHEGMIPVYPNAINIPTSNWPVQDFQPPAFVQTEPRVVEKFHFNIKRKKPANRTRYEL